jgi:hypothetical protein
MHNRDDIKDLAEAYCLMQAELPTASKSSKGLRSKFADIVEVIETSRPILAKHGLAVIQEVIDISGNPGLRTTLIHKSGQSISEIMLLFPEKNMTNGSNYNHALGGCITYFRRYSYMAIIGMVAENEDNDGYTPNTNYNQSSSYAKASADTQPKIYDHAAKISPDQLSEIQHALKGYPKLVDEVKAHFKIAELKDIPSKDYRWTVDKIRERKHAEYGIVN